MKRTFIAGAGVAILGVAALPFTGVFAADGAASVTDSIRLTVGESCQMETDTDGSNVTWETGMAGSEYEPKSGTKMQITCNTAQGWTLKATASDLVNVANAARKIEFGAYDKTATESMWSAAISVTGEGTYEVAENWDDFSASKPSDTVILSGTIVNGLEVTPEYKAYISEGTVDGFYRGEIYYTFAQNQ